MAGLACAVLLTPLAGCGDDSDAGDATTVTVFAAASLTQTFTDLAAEFEAQHDGVEVRLSFGGSADLVEQIRQGAPADVFASADAETMAKAGALVSSVATFATNTLEIAVPPGNPAGIASLADLERDGLRLVVCASEVPCGAATRRVAEVAGVALRPVSEEQAVTDVLGKVAAGEADAGLVYRTDVIGAGGDVDGVAFPEAAGVVNRYQIGVVAQSEESDLASRFMGFVLGDTGQRTLARAGFGEP